MRHVKNRLIDFAFRHEREQSETVKNLIAETYAAALRLRADCFELATRRYRKGEHRIKTCWDMNISDSQYYKLLSKFLSVARDTLVASAVVVAS